jgi:integrase
MRRVLKTIYIDAGYPDASSHSGLLAACRKSSWKPLYRLVLLAMTTGMRKSELMNLRWSDIDFTRSVAMLATTKNGEPHHCPIPSVAPDELKAIRKVAISPIVICVVCSKLVYALG